MVSRGPRNVCHTDIIFSSSCYVCICSSSSSLVDMIIIQLLLTICLVINPLVSLSVSDEIMALRAISTS
jgi:hypothetical protein